MRKLIALVAMAAGPILCPPAALAQPAPTTAQDPNITVEANRLICRRMARTATRMGSSSRVCRTQSEWRSRGVRMSSSNDNVEDAQDSLETFGQGATTGDTGGMGAGHDGPQGPR